MKDPNKVKAPKVRRPVTVEQAGTRGRRGASLHPKPPFAEQHQRALGLKSKLKPPPKYLAAHYRAAGKLQGRTALIVGEDSGIGRAVAVLFGREGANEAISYLPVEQPDAAETKTAVEATGVQCLLRPGDITDAGFCEEVIEKTVNQFGQLDVLVSNTAHQSCKKTLDELTDEDLDVTFKTNIYAYLRLARAALRYLKPGSAIIATSSETGIKGSQDLPDYSATKGAINAFTKTLLVRSAIFSIALEAGTSPIPVVICVSDLSQPPRVPAAIAAGDKAASAAGQRQRAMRRP